MSYDTVQEQENARLAMLDAFYEAQLQSPAAMATRSATLLSAKPRAGRARKASVKAGVPFGFRPEISVVAQGDSWFDYLPGNDVIKALKRRGFVIKNYGTGGDTLENMLFSTTYKEGTWERAPAEHEQVLASVRQIKPKFFLFSGGGNDIAGPELAPYLNHFALKPNEPLRTDHLAFMFNQVFRQAYEFMLQSVEKAHPGVRIILHGYGHAIPTGEGVIKLWNWRFIGPWLLPSMIAKGIRDPITQIAIIKTMIDAFNDMLAEVAKGRPNVHYIDLRGLIKDGDWINELHLNRAGYEKVADQYETVMMGQMAESEKAALAESKTFVSAFLAGDEAAMGVLRHAQ
jgi:lysophospholipase L1-like esterase